MSEKVGQREKKHEFLICIDSDGTMMDNMELKHKECFCPATVNVWEMQCVSKYLREAAEFVNLYSRTRGINRFLAVIKTLEMTFQRPEVQQRLDTFPDLDGLKAWTQSAAALSAGALEAYIRQQQAPSAALETALRWSREVDESIEKIVRNIQPFPFARETVSQMSRHCDLAVVSGTPRQTVCRELGKSDLLDFFCDVAGQEDGTKADSIRRIMGRGYDGSCVLKVGDAIGDYEAAQKSGVLFYPILPGQESFSWQRLKEEALQRFLAGTYRGQYAQTLLEQFLQALPEAPAWA